MELFDKRFVHFMWDNELEGKEGFFADDIATLEGFVNTKAHVFIVSKSKLKDKPFSIKGGGFRFFYYDPSYDCKKAYAEGKQIQYQFPDGDMWYDINEADREAIEKKGLSWFDDDVEYRIKPEEQKPRRMTYRELAEWLAKGNGQLFNIAKRFCMEIEYRMDYDGCLIPIDYKIRRWSSDEWIEPTVDIYEADCKKESE